MIGEVVRRKASGSDAFQGKTGEASVESNITPSMSATSTQAPQRRRNRSVPWMFYASLFMAAGPASQMGNRSC